MMLYVVNATPVAAQVRTHAALALGTLQSYTPSQLSQVWEALIHGLEDSEQHSDFSEFRQVANLRVQASHLKLQCA